MVLAHQCLSRMGADEARRALPTSLDCLCLCFCSGPRIRAHCHGKDLRVQRPHRPLRDGRPCRWKSRGTKPVVAHGGGPCWAGCGIALVGAGPAELSFCCTRKLPAPPQTSDFLSFPDQLILELAKSVADMAPGRRQDQPGVPGVALAG